MAERRAIPFDLQIQVHAAPSSSGVTATGEFSGTTRRTVASACAGVAPIGTLSTTTPNSPSKPMPSVSMR